uniref:Testicular haploid expressed protein n=1 Tax=Panagrolaimus davidi TaxID=227884 RepID=A0A914Q4U9_9BILA
MYKRHPSAYKRAPVPPQQHPEPEIQRKKVENEKDGHLSTPVKRERASINYVNQTPTKSQALAHPPGWEKITWAPKVCRVRRFDFGKISTAAH